MCAWKGCDFPAYASDLCRAHNRRRSVGAPMSPPVTRRRGWKFESLNRAISYKAAHNRVRSLWGLAKNYKCVICGGPAKDWAYDHTDPTEFTGTARGAMMKYSIWPEFYMPMCRHDHAAFDHPGKVGVAEGYEGEPDW